MRSYICRSQITPLLRINHIHLRNHTKVISSPVDTVAESCQVAQGGCTAVWSDFAGTLAASLMVTQGGGAAVRSARVAESGRTAPHYTSDGATTVGYNLHRIVTGQAPIELKWCDFTLQIYSVGGSCQPLMGAVDNWSMHKWAMLGRVHVWPDSLVTEMHNSQTNPSRGRASLKHKTESVLPPEAWD